MKEPVWIDERDALALHDRLLALDGGAAGVRDVGLLQSALARPQQLHAYGDAPDTIDMAAAYTVGIVRNHPFVDGNKRTALAACLVFLETNELLPTAKLPIDEWEKLMLDVAASKIDRAAATQRLRRLLKHPRKRRG